EKIFIFRIFYGIYQHGPTYQRRVVYRYKTDGKKNTPQCV
ncbi:hypothetical protein, partial [Methylomonas fluvii]